MQVLPGEFGATDASVRGERLVERGERRLGRLHDLVLDPDGSISALVIDSDGGRLEVPCAGGLQLGNGILRC